MTPWMPWIEVVPAVRARSARCAKPAQSAAGTRLALPYPVLHPAPTVADFTRAPEGRYVRGEHLVYWAQHAGTSGFRVWGAPTKDDVDLLCAAIDPRATRSSSGLAGIADAR